MAGIYLHFPFCKQACNYCDFHFSTNAQRLPEMVASMLSELELRRNELKGETITTIYFGGGSPSLLTYDQFRLFIDSIHRNYQVADQVELTLEANPDDFHQMELKKMAKTGLNRLSIGIQSFHEQDLQFMNRAHNAKEAVEAVQIAQEAGISNISIDLIYGFNQLSAEKWMYNLNKVNELDIKHLSAYNLTVEKGTLLNDQIKKGKIAPLKEELALEQMNYLMDWADKNHWQHYEISNFCREDNYSIHNTSYWQGKQYLGIGPSAHSFSGLSRRWNVKNNALYIKSVKEGEVQSEMELLSSNDRYNEYILTSLRTIWGISELEINRRFGMTYWKSIHSQLTDLVQQGELVLKDDRYSLSKKGKLVADKIASDLFQVD